MHHGIVWNQWRDGKMTDDQCYRDLVRCRDPRAPMAILAFENLCKKERMLTLQDEITDVQRSLRNLQRPFRSSRIIDKWKQQFGPAHYGVKGRFSILALVGGSQQGKTSKAVSIFGIENTLKVGCISCPEGTLPALSSFSRAKHQCIVFDECRVDQILKNREFFQSSVYPQALSQSVCNQHMYEVWVYQVAMVVCCNDLAMTESDGLSESDADWMMTNVVTVRLGPCQTWFNQDEFP